MHEGELAPATLTKTVGRFAKLWAWVSEYLLKRIFSRQQQISAAYSNQLSRTLDAIQYRDSANDLKQPLQQTSRLPAHSKITITGKSTPKTKPTIH